MGGLSSWWRAWGGVGGEEGEDFEWEVDAELHFEGGL